MHGKEGVAARVGVIGTVIIIPEVKPQKASVTVCGKMWRDIGQQIIYAGIDMCQQRRAGAGGKQRDRRVDRLPRSDSGKVGTQNLDLCRSALVITDQAPCLGKVAGGKGAYLHHRHGGVVGQIDHGKTPV